ncbi:hypothetical protein TWF788_001020 [Orbilia oligospora]|uniref:Uncharacterized protein n=1 Tax=Orbilia oligospora TaxID=2813651 RepID=A0A6G1M320_ORBOL|nr:hypothetical protein TWF788_001020 [Orbilia oligospora]KAF3242230.1 hypothetical protein TWF192_008717 [Orbilia oligospora]
MVYVQIVDSKDVPTEHILEANKIRINYIEGIESKSKFRVSFLRRFDYAPIPNPRKRTPYDV